MDQHDTNQMVNRKATNDRSTVIDLENPSVSVEKYSCKYTINTRIIIKFVCWNEYEIFNNVFAYKNFNLLTSKNCNYKIKNGTRICTNLPYFLRDVIVNDVVKFHFSMRKFLFLNENV